MSLPSMYHEENATNIHRMDGKGKRLIELVLLINRKFS